jgi:hypothetical protein
LPGGGPGDVGAQQGTVGGWGPYIFGNERGQGTSIQEDLPWYGGKRHYSGGQVVPGGYDSNVMGVATGGTGLINPATGTPYPLSRRVDYDVIPLAARLLEPSGARVSRCFFCWSPYRHGRT